MSCQNSYWIQSPLKMHTISETRPRPHLFGRIVENHEGKKFILIPDSLIQVFEAKTFLLLVITGKFYD